MHNGTKCRYGKFKIYLIGVLMLWTTVSVKLGECSATKPRIPETSFLTNFVQKFIQPYIQSLHLSTNTPVLRSSNETPIQKAISDAVDNLKRYLQDEDNDNDDKVQSDGNGETTIIEILPKPHNILRLGEETQKNASADLQTSIRKYEKIKSEIKAALERDFVAEKTKKMVTRTLDDLIAQVIGNQCTWKSADNSKSMTFRNGKNVKHNITVEEWEDLKKRYFDFLERKQLNKSMLLFNNFHSFFSKVINDTEKLSERYKIKCQLVKVDGNDKSTVGKEIERAQDVCKDFKVCSEELRDFLIHFYKSINDTTVSVFKNYAAMYMRDVITDGEDSKEINAVPNLIENISNAVEHRVRKVFFQELKNLKLNKLKNKEANIKILREFTRETCKRVQKHVKKHLSSDLAALKARLLLTVKQDINMNLGVDLGNLEADLKERICTVFITCNGLVSASRRSSFTPRINPNSVYVKVQLSLDDRLKDAISRTSLNLINMRRNIPNDSKRNYQMNFRRYGNLNVTRTTFRVESTSETMNSNFSYINNVLRNSIIEKF